MRTFTTGFFLFSFFALRAQFEGLGSFVNDTTFNKMIVANRVKCVVETIKDSSGTRFHGRYCFTRQGKATDMIFARGNGFDRIRYKYNKAGEVIRGEGFGYNDTVTVSSWKDWTLDSAGRTIREVKGYIHDGKTNEHTTYECQYLSQGKGKTAMLVHRYDPNIFKHTTITGRDSISGRDTFFVSYEFRGQEPRGFAEKKELSHLITRDSCIYKDELVYNVYGLKETVKDIKTAYYQYDRKGRLLEYGTMDYRETYMDFMQDHPEDFNPSYYSPLFIAAVMEGKVQGHRKPERSNKFNGRGLVAESSIGEYQYRFEYDQKTRLVQQTVTGQKKPVSVQRHFYNEKGLIIKAVVTHTDEKGRSSRIETNYRYSFY